MSSQPPAQTTQQRARHLASNLWRRASTPRIKRIGAWILGLFIAFSLIIFFALPPLLKPRLEQALSTALHRPVHIESLSLNPYVLSARLRGLRIDAKQGTAPLLELDELYANISSTSIFRLAPVLDAIRVVHPRVHLARLEDKRYSVQDLIDEWANKPPSEPARYALNNIEVINGSIDFDDRAEKQMHQVRSLNLGIPFLSSLPYATDITVQPKLSAVINGAPFLIQGETKPFADTHETVLHLNLDKAQLPIYLDYVPVPLRFKLKSGQLDAQLHLSFHTAAGELKYLVVWGVANIDKLDMRDASSAPLFAADKLALKLNGYDAVSNSLSVATLQAIAPSLALTRFKDGHLNLDAFVPQAAPAAASPATAPTDTPVRKPFVFHIDHLDIQNGSVRFADQGLSQPFSARLHHLNVQAKAIGNRPDTKGEWKIATQSDAQGRLEAQGELGLQPLAGGGKLNLTGLQLKSLAPFYAGALNAQIASGSLDVKTGFSIAQNKNSAAAEGKQKSQPAPIDVQLSDMDVALHDVQLQLPGAKTPMWRIPLAQLRDADIDLNKHTAQIAEFSSRDGAGVLKRDRQGRFELTQLLKAPTKDAAAAAAKATPATEAAPAAPWQWTLKKASLQNYALDYVDESPAKAAQLKFTQMNVQADNLSSDAAQPAQINLKATVNKAGTLVLNGPLNLNPMNGNFRVEAKNVDLLPLEPYWFDKVGFSMRRAALSGKGELHFGGETVLNYKGDLQLNNVSAIDRAAGDPLLRWRSLALSGVSLALSPFKTSIDHIALGDFFARIVVHPNGKLNLQEVVAPQSASAAPATAAAAPEQTAAPENPDEETAQPTEQTQTSTAAVAAKDDSTAPPDAPKHLLQIGGVQLSNGRISFADFFVKPNYSAELQKFNGSISAIRPNLAGKVDIKAMLEGGAPVAINGEVNPLSKELFLDLHANARDVDLPPLSPYSVKYAGYGIERGKLSLEVHYHIEDRQLTAQNQVTLNQLTFGEHVDSPTATKLPVLLAVSLLKDRNGVIDVNLPISGSLDDPQFSVTGLVGRVIFNLIVKAVTSPFALIGSVFGSASDSESLAYVEFDPGSAVLDEGDKKKLETLVKALNDRPGLKLDIIGRVDPVPDSEALKHTALMRAMRIQKAKDSGAPSIRNVQIEPAEYNKYLGEAYSAADIKKPRNFIGIAKDLPPAEMERLMLENLQVDENRLRELANERAAATKEWLLEHGAPGDRTFLLSPKLNAAGIKDEGAKTRVDFALR